MDDRTTIAMITAAIARSEIVSSSSPDRHLPDMDDADVAPRAFCEVLGDGKRPLRVVGMVDGDENCLKHVRSP